MNITLALPEGFTYESLRSRDQLLEAVTDALKHEVAARTCALCLTPLMGEGSQKATVARGTWVHDGCLADYAYDQFVSQQMEAQDAAR